MVVIKRISKYITLLAIMLASQPLFSQVGYQFGQNKVHYKDFEWAVFRTEHFDVHYYSEEKEAAQDAARMAERGYAYLSETLDHNIKNRIPLILYASLNDFQQTNVVGGLLGQGTRGVTESLKNRVILPITGSYREFHHVLVHELVHAFQFDMIFHSDYKNSRFNPPLWFVEGMAEYLSNGMDNVTRMWVRDGVQNDRLLSVSELGRARDIRVYRLGQSLWHYIGETQGKDKVGQIFRAAIVDGDIDKALKKQLNMTTKELTEAWHTYAAGLSVPSDSTLLGSAEFADKISSREGYFHRMNIVPAISPDGRRMAYVANKNLNDEIYLKVFHDDGSTSDELLIKGGASKQFETLRFFDTAISWSSDGQHLAFVSKSGQDDAIYVMDPDTKEILHKFVFKQLNGVLSPVFSPDGNRLVFSGIAGGISDLYLLSLENGDLRRLTRDKFAVLHPAWSPDGASIAYVTDRGPGTDEADLLFGSFELAIYDMAGGSVKLVGALPGNNTNPQWSADSRQIAFLSDHTGITNIYRLDLDSNRIVQLTDLKDGVDGITGTTPAFSWSTEGRVMVFSSFTKEEWQLFRFSLDENGTPIPRSGPMAAGPSTENELRPELPARDLSEAIANVPGDSLPQQVSAELPALADANELYTGYALAPIDSVSAENYSHRFKLDAVTLGGGYNSYFGGSGGAQFLFSDMLGNQNVYFSTELQFSDPRHSDFGLTYLNLGNRINFGLQAFQSSYSYTQFLTFSSIGFVRNTFRGFNGIAAYPFSRFMRAELSAGLTWVDQDFVEDVYSFSGRDRQTFNLSTFKYGQLGGALIYDNTLYGLMGPLSGIRGRFSVETTTNDFQFTNYITDIRSYKNIKHRSVLAFRALGGASTGRDEQVFGIGGPFSYRGADYGDLLGTRFLVTNMEFRFPAFPWAPASFDLLSLATYFDTAAAWGIDAPGLISESFQPFTTDGGFRLNDLNAALGIGARLNLGYFNLQYDVAWPTDLQGFGSAVNRFSIGTFF